MAEPPNNSLPSPSMESLFYMLATSALVNLGEVPNPVDQQKKTDLAMASHNIDTIALLQQKTKGNLTPAEERLCLEILNELRLKFASASQVKK
jgi:hypothetical protein